MKDNYLRSPSFILEMDPKSDKCIKLCSQYISMETGVHTHFIHLGGFTIYIQIIQYKGGFRSVARSGLGGGDFLPEHCRCKASVLGTGDRIDLENIVLDLANHSLSDRRWGVIISDGHPKHNLTSKQFHKRKSTNLFLQLPQTQIHKVCDNTFMCKCKCNRKPQGKRGHGESWGMVNKSIYF